MKSFTTQILLIIAAGFFLMKGGVGLIVASWKLLLPLAFLGGAYYLGKKAFSGSSTLKGAQDSSRMKAAAGGDTYTKTTASGQVIEICPHCLSEIGSCPKCKKGRRF